MTLQSRIKRVAEAVQAPTPRLRGIDWGDLSEAERAWVLWRLGHRSSADPDEEDLRSLSDEELHRRMEEAKRHLQELGAEVPT